MFKQLKKYLNLGPKIYGIEIFEHNRALHYEVLEVRQSKNELVVSNNYTFDKWQDVAAGLDPKIPICLCVNTEDVLHKIVVEQTKFNDATLIEHIFPNIAIERFYYNISLFRKHHYLALVEKAKIDAVLKTFEDSKLSVINYCIGLSSLAYLLDYFGDETIHTTTKTLSFGQGEFENSIAIESQKKDALIKPYEINGLNINYTKLLGFGAIIESFNKGSKKNYNHLLKIQQQKFRYSRGFQVLLWPIIIFFFLLLLGNFLMFNQYYGKYNGLEIELNSKNTNKERLVQLKESLVAKERRVAAVLSNKNSKSTLFMDDIGKSIPNAVLLEHLIYQPISKPMREGKPIAQEFNEILISGETNDAEAFSNWIAVLENLEWVTQVETLSYGFKSSNSSVFSIKVMINEE